MSSLNVSNAFRFVFGPSRCVSDACTTFSSRSCSRSPSAPTSAKPAAKITAKRGFFSSTVSKDSIALLVRITARSTSPGTSAIVSKQGSPSTVSRFGLTGKKSEPACSAQARILRVIAAVGLPVVSDAPRTATERGRKNVPRSSSRSAIGRPVTSRRAVIRGRQYLTRASGNEGGGVPIRPRRGLLELRRDAQQEVLPAVRPDELDADRQAGVV